MKQNNYGSGIYMLIAMTLVVSLASCGSDTDTRTAPFGSTITISPDTVTTNGPSGACTGEYKDQLFRITVLDPRGQPMNDIAVTVTLDWAPNYSHPTWWTMQLYDVDTGGGAPVTVPYVTSTIDGGTKSFIVRYDISCDFKGQIEAFSGSAYEKADIEVN